MAAPPEEPSAFALSFGEKRLSEALKALRRLSPSLAAEVAQRAGDGPLFLRMKRASEAIRSASDKLSSDRSIEAELRKSIGAGYTPFNARALLSAHSAGLMRLASPEGLGAAIFLSCATDFRMEVEAFAVRQKTPEPLRSSALELVDTWVRSLLGQAAPDDPDDPVLALAYMPERAAAEKWSLKLFLRCTHLTEDDAVRSLILGAFSGKAAEREPSS